jgi:hypothetical protein
MQRKRVRWGIRETAPRILRRTRLLIDTVLKGQRVDTRTRSACRHHRLRFTLVNRVPTVPNFLDTIDDETISNKESKENWKMFAKC